MSTRLALIAILALILTGCGYNSKVLEKSGSDQGALASARIFKVAAVEFKWVPSADWDVSGEDWEKRRKELSEAFTQEIKLECNKQVDVLKMDDKPTEGVLLGCIVYHADKGGWGGTGVVRAEVSLTDIKTGKLLYKAKIEGTSRNAGYEGNSAWGRVKFGLINIAREACDVMEDGAQ